MKQNRVGKLTTLTHTHSLTHVYSHSTLCYMWNTHAHRCTRALPSILQRCVYWKQWNIEKSVAIRRRKFTITVAKWLNRDSLLESALHTVSCTAYTVHTFIYFCGASFSHRPLTFYSISSRVMRVGFYEIQHVTHSRQQLQWYRWMRIQTLIQSFAHSLTHPLTRHTMTHTHTQQYTPYVYKLQSALQHTKYTFLQGILFRLHSFCSSSQCIRFVRIVLNL